MTEIHLFNNGAGSRKLHVWSWTTMQAACDAYEFYRLNFTYLGTKKDYKWIENNRPVRFLITGERTFAAVVGSFHQMLYWVKEELAEEVPHLKPNKVIACNISINYNIIQFDYRPNWKKVGF